MFVVGRKGGLLNLASLLKLLIIPLRYAPGIVRSKIFRALRFEKSRLIKNPREVLPALPGVKFKC